MRKTTNLFWGEPHPEAGVGRCFMTSHQRAK